MGYFDNFDNGHLNKYQKFIENKKIDMLFYLIDNVLNFI
jgi:hypothetical protein